MGKQIRIYLADDSATGVRHAEISNWTGQALCCPRSRFGGLRDWDEVRRPGVYLLFGVTEETGEDAVYIGESEVVLDRIAAHMSGKDFWSELIAFTSKDETLTKAHVRYLEARLIEMAMLASRYRVTNAAAPQLPALPRADRDAMEEYLAHVRTLAGVLGHKVLEPFASIRKPESVSSDPSSKDKQPEVASPLLSHGTDLTVKFFLKVGDLTATSIKTDEGLVVLAGSDAAMQARASLSGGYRAVRDHLIATHVLVAEGEKLKLRRDQLFSSPSQAAAVLVGYSINGREAWRLADGSSYAKFEEMVTNQLLDELATKASKEQV